jgi:hypothetical protein
LLNSFKLPAELLIPSRPKKGLQRFQIRGCRIGLANPFLKLLKRVLGNTFEVVAPKHWEFIWELQEEQHGDMGGRTIQIHLYARIFNDARTGKKIMPFPKWKTLGSPDDGFLLSIPWTSALRKSAPWAFRCGMGCKQG